MKKSALLSVALSALLLCSCSNNNGKSSNYNTKKEEQYQNLQTVSEIYSQLDNQKQTILNTNYDNLSFDKDFYISMPDISEVSVFETYIYDDEIWTPEESIKYFDKVFDAFFSDIYTDEDKKELYRIFPSPDYEGDWDEPYPSNLPLYYENEEAVLSGEMGNYCYIFGNENGYMELFSGFMNRVSRCDAASLVEEFDSYHPGILMLSDYLEPEEFIMINENTDLSRKIKLMNGEITLGEAVSFCEDFLKDALVWDPDNNPFDIRVSAVKLYKIDEEFYALNMSITKKYNNVNFDAVNMRYSDGSLSSVKDSGEKVYSDMPSNVVMVKTDMVDSVVGMNINKKISNEKKYDKILSPQDAVGIISESITGVGDYDFYGLELVYSGNTETNKEGFKYDKVNPEWRLSAINKSEALEYYFYVNALDGTFRYVAYSIDTGDFEE